MKTWSNVLTMRAKMLVLKINLSENKSKTKLYIVQDNKTHVNSMQLRN